MFIGGGIIVMTGFFLWSRSRAAAGETPLLALEVVGSSKEWMAVAALFIIVSTEGAINFSVPLYIQIVQGQSSMRTSIAMMPFMLTVFFTAILIVRLYSKFPPRTIARWSFAIVAVGTAWLAFVARNDWSTVPVIMGLITVGLGQGALVTLFFNVLVTAAPKELAGDVGSLRGVTQNMAAAVGTAVVGTLLVGILSSVIVSSESNNPVLTSELKDQVNLTNLSFMCDDAIRTRLAETTATPAQVTEALSINGEARTGALETGFLIMSALSLIALLPCGWLPDYRPGEIPADDRRKKA